MIFVWFTYPIWGWFLLLPFCAVVARAIHGTIVYRLCGAVFIGALASAIFTPLIVGGQGFMFAVPWEAEFIDHKSYGPFYWPLAIPLFGLAFIVALAFTKRGEIANRKK